MNTVQEQKDRLISIAADENVTSDEVEEFAKIQEELEKISISVETLQMWVEQMISEGVIKIKGADYI